jgi:archaellum biogenesis ATPase FlaH
MTQRSTPVSDFAKKLCMVERDRATAAEICIDELLTIMDRHEPRDLGLYVTLRKLSAKLSNMLLSVDGPAMRRERLIRVRQALTQAFPMTDEDLEAQS